MPISVSIVLWFASVGVSLGFEVPFGVSNAISSERSGRLSCLLVPSGICVYLPGVLSVGV